MLFHKKRISFSYCGDETPSPVALFGNAASTELKVIFTSDKKTAGSGAQCTAMCLDDVSGTIHCTGPFVINDWPIVH